MSLSSWMDYTCYRTSFTCNKSVLCNLVLPVSMFTSCTSISIEIYSWTPNSRSSPPILMLSCSSPNSPFSSITSKSLGSTRTFLIFIEFNWWSKISIKSIPKQIKRISTSITHWFSDPSSRTFPFYNRITSINKNWT